MHTPRAHASRLGETVLNDAFVHGVVRPLSGRGNLDLIVRAKARRNAERSISRVRNRVARGGHSVPDADVRRRYERAMTNPPERFGWQVFPLLRQFGRQGPYRLVGSRSLPLRRGARPYAHPSPVHYNRTTVPGKTFYIETFGCQMNAHDSEKVVGTLLVRGLLRRWRRRTTRGSCSITLAASATRPSKRSSTACRTSSARG